MTLGINGRFYAAPVTGVQRFAREVAARLLQDADTVLLLPAGVQAPAEAGARMVRGSLQGHAWEQLELPRQARAARCDAVLHLAGTLPLRARRGHRDVFVVHDVLTLTHPQWFSRGFRAWRGAVLHLGAPRAGRLVTVSAWARDEIVRSLGVPASRVDVVTQGLEPFDGPAGPEAVAGVRERYGLEGPFLLALGAGDPRKNLPFLEEVLARWPQGPPPPLLIAGAGAAHLFRAPRWSPGAGIRLLGRVDDTGLHALYTAAAALAFPSLAEGFGRPPLEALACGTPAVAADFGAAREALGDAAEILPLDADLWAAALARLVADPGDRAQRLERGRDLARRYRWDAAAQQVRASCARAAWKSA